MTVDMGPEAVERPAKRLEGTPLHEGSREESDLPEEAAATLRAEVARLREIALRLLYVAASEKHDTKTARYLVQNLAWPGDAPDAVHCTLEEARAALAQKESGE